MTIPKTKTDFLERHATGEFGNRFRDWRNTADFLKELRKPGYVTIRSRERDSPHFLPVIEGSNVVSGVSQLIARGARWDDLYVQEVPAPDTHRILNLEAGLGWDGKFWTRIGWPGTSENLRHDLEKHGREISGLCGKNVLKMHLSEEWPVLENLIYKYPGAVIEATMWPRSLGTENRRLIIWEVRGY